MRGPYEVLCKYFTPRPERLARQTVRLETPLPHGQDLAEIVDMGRTFCPFFPR